MKETYDSIPMRYEMTRLVRNVLIRHRADLEVIFISCTARFVYLSGNLVKTTKPGYKPSDVDLIFREIEQIPMVRGIEADLENWSVSALRSTGAWFIVPRRRVLQTGAAAADQGEHKIEDVEEIKDVLDDLKKKKPET